MEISSLIDRVGSTRRDYAGTFQTAALPLAGNEFDATIALLRSDAAVYFDGTFLRAGTTVPVPFTFTIPFATVTTHGASGEVSCSLVGKVSGPMLSSADGFEFIGRAASVTVALHLRFTAPESFDIGGMVFHSKGSLAFSASPATQREKRVKTKVYAIRPIRG
jgi:hypothetical protein